MAASLARRIALANREPLTGGRWITLNGGTPEARHVYIRGGQVVSGNKALKGTKVEDLKGEQTHEHGDRDPRDRDINKGGPAPDLRDPKGMQDAIADLESKWGKGKFVVSDKVKAHAHNHDTVRLHVEHLAKVPASLVERLAGKLNIGVSSSTVGEAFPELGSQRVRGWGGRTWKSVPGIYYTSKNTVYAGGGGIGHGSVSLVLHELGHGIGDKLGFDDHPDLIAAHRAGYDTFPPYQKQGGPGGFAGRQELLAEGFATYMVSGAEETTKKWGEKFTAFITDVVFPKAKT
jgi:hypothetical protein